MIFITLLRDNETSLGNFLAGSLYFINLCRTCENIQWDITLQHSVPETDISKIICSAASCHVINNTISQINNSAHTKYYMCSYYWNRVGIQTPPAICEKFIKHLALASETISESILFLPKQESMLPQIQKKIQECLQILPNTQVLLIKEDSFASDLQSLQIMQNASHIYQICSDLPYSAGLSEVASVLWNVPLTLINLDYPPQHLHNSNKACILFQLTNHHGFFSSLFFLISSYCYAKHIGLPFFIQNNGWQYTHKLGWHDYFSSLLELPEHHEYLVYTSNAGYTPSEEEIITALREIYTPHSHIIGQIPKYDTSIYVRRGDKYVESSFVSEEVILQICFPPSPLFVQSDDYTVIEKFQSLLPTHIIETLTLPTERGSYYCKEYVNVNNITPNLEKSPQQIFDETCVFLRAIQICIQSKVCWTDSESNVGKFQKYMSPNTVQFYR
jgi:hypothetical protein